MSGFATATAGLYFLIGLAHVRVGYFLRRARAICVLFAVHLGLKTAVNRLFSSGFVPFRWVPGHPGWP